MGEKIIKKRKIRLDAKKGHPDGNGVRGSLVHKDGIISVDFDHQKNRILVEYELQKINFDAIEHLLCEQGFVLSKKWQEKFKRGMSKFTEQNEMDNLKAPVSSCCDDPKSGAKACKR